MSGVIDGFRGLGIEGLSGPQHQTMHSGQFRNFQFLNPSVFYVRRSWMFYDSLLASTPAQFCL
jgi:hypothetical protein